MSTKFLDTYADLCITKATSLTAQGIPRTDDRWNLYVTLDEYLTAIKAGFPMIAGVRFAVADKSVQVVEMCLCEVEHILLRPGVLYRFKVKPGCKRGKELASPYKNM